MVDGSSSLSRRNAWRNVRPTPLKQASIMWCVFSPVMVTADSRLETLRQRLEEVRHQLGRQATHGFARELAFEHAEGAPGRIDGDAHLRLIHGQYELITRNAHLVAERHVKGFANASAQSSTVWCSDCPWHLSSSESCCVGDLLEHVIEETDAGGNGDRRGGVHRDVDVGLLRRTGSSRGAP